MKTQKVLAVIAMVSMAITACSVAPNDSGQQGLDEAVKQLGDVSGLSRYTRSSSGTSTNSDGSTMSYKATMDIFIDSTTDPKVLKSAFSQVATGSADSNNDGTIDVKFDNEEVGSQAMVATLAKITVTSTAVNEDGSAFNTAGGYFVTRKVTSEKTKAPTKVGGTGKWENQDVSGYGISTNFVKVEGSKLTIYDAYEGMSDIRVSSDPEVYTRK
ncbi:MAG: hypothetical protein ACRC9L_00905 [Brevinema sp.]